MSYTHWKVTELGFRLKGKYLASSAVLFQKAVRHPRG